MQPTNILITGASGQIGQVLYDHLVTIYGEASVIASDIHQLDSFHQFEFVDITDKNQILDVITKHNITEVYHLAAILSAKAEQKPILGWNINMSGLLNILEAAVEKNINKVFYPSSMAVFGNHIDLAHVSQYAVQHPTSLYGISKSAGENWCQYYFNKYNLDVRSLRFPGLIGPTTLPGGGTTDYAVHIYHAALKDGNYTCYLEPDATLPMMYMDDALDAMSKLMQAPASAISIRTSYNIQAISFSPAEIAASIRAEIPDFEMTYAPDYRQAIADSWPRVMDDAPAQADWNWQPNYNLEQMTKDMLSKINNHIIQS